MITFKDMNIEDIKEDFLIGFNEGKNIKNKYIKTPNGWKVIETNNYREWNSKKRKWIPQYLCQQIKRGGFSIFAFDNEKVVGFVSIDGYKYGQKAKYMNLTMLFVDDKYQRKGIGKKLFFLACDIASKKRADKIFISAIPSVETVLFYQNIGCVDANEVIEDYIDTEYDRYLEYPLKQKILFKNNVSDKKQF